MSFQPSPWTLWDSARSTGGSSIFVYDEIAKIYFLVVGVTYVDGSRASHRLKLNFTKFNANILKH